jgi:hypothetical protein
VRVAPVIRGVHRLMRILMLVALMPVSGAAAQTLNPGPPGPFVFDLRAVTSAIPASETFVPEGDTTATVPARGFGGSIGAHLYPLQLGPARLGVGVDFLFARGTTADVTATLGSVDPQVSANFGTADGWSYLSAGYGITRVSADPAGVSESMPSLNWGGGARWFLTPHFGVGFDVRVHHISAGDVIPKDTAVAVTVGASLK